jgi:hypothetical protein
MKIENSDLVIQLVYERGQILQQLETWEKAKGFAYRDLTLLGCSNSAQLKHVDFEIIRNMSMQGFKIELTEIEEKISKL